MLLVVTISLSTCLQNIDTKIFFIIKGFLHGVLVHGRIEILPSFKLEGEKEGFIIYKGDLADSGEGRICVKK